MTSSCATFRQQQGGIVSNRLENIVRRAARSLREAQKAKLWKIPNDLRITTSGLAVFSDQSPSDFMGHTIQGRAIMLECKDIKAPSLAFGRSGLKAHQWIALQECHDAGGLALLAWSRGDWVSLLDMDLVRALSKDRHSIPWAKIPEQWVRPFTEHGMIELFDQHRIGGS